VLRQQNHKNKRKKTENIFEINKRLLFFNKTICLSLINRRKKYGTSFYQEKEIQDLGWGPTADQVNHKSKTQQFSTKMVIKDNSPKLPLPRTIQRTHLGARQSNDRLPTQKRPKFQQLSSKYQKTINALSSQSNQLRTESIKSQLSWNFSRSLDQGMNKRHKSTTVHKQWKKLM